METEVHAPKKKTILFAASGLIVFFIFVALALILWAQTYDKKIAPHVLIGSVLVEGLTAQQAKERVQEKIDMLISQGISVTVNGITKPLALSTINGTDVTEDVSFDLDLAVTNAIRLRHNSNPIVQTWQVTASLWQRDHIALPVNIVNSHIQKSVYDLFPDAETLGQNASFVFTSINGMWTVETTKDVPGNEFSWKPFFEQLSDSLAQLETKPIDLGLKDRQPDVTQALADAQKAQAVSIIKRAPFSFTTEPEEESRLNWILSPHALSTMLLPTMSENVQVDEKAFQSFLDPIAKTLERSPENARLKIENLKVVDFVAAKNGIMLDRDKLYQTFSEQITNDSDEPIEIRFLAQPPEIKNADVADLGITEVLGSGISSYKGSPKNRRGNIQNGVNLLNGRLIAPGEIFSLISALKPFDEKNGYTPELVIKGDKITPELGGGLCQIGTTTFRAVMNSGLPVVERHNHSLVVSYYNDPSNKKPGTDATIYDPSPDFKFTNDTGHYLLLQTENLVAKQQLKFTFWGTSDGRKGSYEPPIVSRWIPAGDPITTQTTDLKPGEEKCQEAHVGADASFTYTITRPDGTQEVTPFSSHYRPLPKICLVGIEKIDEGIKNEEVGSTKTP